VVDVASPGGALEGIRVLDLGLLVQGPQAAQLLRDLGAEVIKVELPRLGDQARWIPISLEDLRAPYFVGCNRGKRSIALDLRVEAGRGVFLRLVDSADVVISNFLPGTLERWGLGYEELARRNPRIVYGSGSAFGSQGPDAGRKGADLAGQAAGGLISSTGSGLHDVTPVGVTISDHIASQNLAAGVLAALYARERTGRGQAVEVSLLGGQIYAQASEYTYTLLTGRNPGHAAGGQ
jgi:crotonobetainyl-CoA:carnitine CoA-transferase CaiB-like acyl-CoA transferase